MPSTGFACCSISSFCFDGDRVVGFSVDLRDGLVVGCFVGWNVVLMVAVELQMLVASFHSHKVSCLHCLLFLNNEQTGSLTLVD